MRVKIRFSMKSTISSSIQIVDYFTSFSGTNYTKLFTDSLGDVYGTGANTYYAIGDGTAVSRTAFVKSNISEVVSVSSGKKSSNNSTFSLAVRSDGSLWGVGVGDQSQFGNDSVSTLSVWTQLISTGVKKVMCESGYSAILKSDNTLWMAGSMYYGGFGDGINSLHSLTTWTQVLSDVKDFFISNYTTYAIKTDNTLWVTGYGTYGKMGNGSTSNLAAFTQINTGVSLVSAGPQHSAFIASNGDLYTTGQSTYYATGAGTTTTKTSFSVALSASIDGSVVGVACNARSTLALTSNGNVYVAGAGEYCGQGSNSFTTFTKVSIGDGVNKVVKMYGMYGGYIVILSNGDIYVTSATSSEYSIFGLDATASTSFVKISTTISL